MAASKQTYTVVLFDGEKYYEHTAEGVRPFRLMVRGKSWEPTSETDGKGLMVYVSPQGVDGRL